MSSVSRSPVGFCVRPSVRASGWEASAYWIRNLWCSCPEWGARAGTGALQGLKPQQEGRHYSLFVLAPLSLQPQRNRRTSQPRDRVGGAGLVSLLS